MILPTIKFSFFTLFPALIDGYFQASIAARALKAGLVSLEFINIRDFATDRHKSVDAPPIGGGAGMLLDPAILGRALEGRLDSRILFLSPCGASFGANDARRLAAYSHISFVCGRYAGFDERCIELYATEVFSIGDFVLTGGELAALCLADSILRHRAGVLGNAKSLEGESFENGVLEAPNFVKSKLPLGLPPPKEYASGNHASLKNLKTRLARLKTAYFRPDLLR